MKQLSGWLFDVYPNHNEGLTVWLMGDDGERHRLFYRYQTRFYVDGEHKQLRAMWRHLRHDRVCPQLARVERRTLLDPPKPMLAVTLAQPLAVAPLLRRLQRRFPDMVYYDVDIPFCLRFSAETDIFPLTRCAFVVDDAGQIVESESLESRWENSAEEPPFKTLTIVPDKEPAEATPTTLTLKFERQETTIRLDQPRRHILTRLNALLKRHDPDIILTAFGDSWLLPTLLAENGIALLTHLNRDPQREPDLRQSSSMTSYGQVLYRAQQVHLAGRYHIDGKNAMLWGDYGIAGTMAQARVTGMPVQEMSRRSPGAGVGALQIMAALKRDLLVPQQKTFVEYEKSALDLMQGDQGGLVFQPIIGVHENVIEVDFVSLYPSIMVKENLSAETMMVNDATNKKVPGMNMTVSHSEQGLIAEMLEPLLTKRIGIKKRISFMDKRDCRYTDLKAQSDGLKWLLVCSFGYAGYRRARFGKIEAHMAITAYARDVLLEAKAAGEALGYTLLHAYVDGLWFQKAGHNPTHADIEQLTDAIEERTQLPIALEGVYNWIVFAPSKRDPRLPVPNRYFGVFRGGELKIRGLELRRRDTPPLIARIQQEMLNRLAKATADSLNAIVETLCRMLRRTVINLRERLIPLDELIVTQVMSRELADYKTPSPAARAAQQLVDHTVDVRPGMKVRFLYVYGRPGVWAWGLPEPFNPQLVDTVHYIKLLASAAQTVLEPFGVDGAWLCAMMRGVGYQLPFSTPLI